MSINSANAGYLLPGSTVGLPKNLSFTQFIQTILVGISGFPGDLVRPDWQPNPPKRPDITINWLAFGVAESTPYNFIYAGSNGTNQNSQFQEAFSVKLSVYGPKALDNYRLIRDGFQISQNLEALTLASMGLVDVSKGIRNPELIDERWYDRWECFVNMRYESQRTYPVLTLVSAEGTIFAPTSQNDDFQVDWLVEL